MSTLKVREVRFHAAVGQHTDELWATYQVTEIKGKKYLGCRYYINGIIGNSCQWGVSDSLTLAGKLGIAL